MNDPHRVLTNTEKNFCEYGAVLGVVLTLVCLVQHSLVVISTPLTNFIVPGYLFAIVAFIALGLQKTYSVVLLIISAALAIIIEWVWMSHSSFSLVVVLLFMYHIAAIIVLFVQDIPKKLKLKKAAEKAERDMWSDKI